jgi:kynurenine formamidase
VVRRRAHARLVSPAALGAVLLALSACSAAKPQPAPSAPSAEPTLADAWRAISSREFVELTHAFAPDTPVWEGFGPAKFTAQTDPKTGRPYTIARDGFHATHYSLVGQYGTHVDPPAHFAPDGKTLDELPVKDMILPLVVFDITPKLAAQPDYALQVDDILEWEKTHGRVPAGSFAALRTDMSKDWTRDPKRFERHPFPAWSFEAIRFLYEQRGIVANGHEAMDTDTTPAMDSETWLLRQGHWQIEVMTNLDQVPATGALLVVAWPKPRGGLGFPVRAFAILP